MFKKYILPLLAILLLSIFLNYFSKILEPNFTFLVIIIRCFLLLLIGFIFSNAKYHKKQNWLPKVLFSIVILIFLFNELNFIEIPGLLEIFNYLGIKGFLVYLIYIYCGYCFFQ